MTPTIFQEKIKYYEDMRDHAETLELKQTYATALAMFLSLKKAHDEQKSVEEIRGY
jgi:hypothetical protein